MTTRKKIALIFAIFSAASCAFCFSISPPIFPAQPPPEFHKVHVGMHVKDVKAILGNNFQVIDDDVKKEEGIVREPGPIWIFWHVHDGAIGVMVRRDDERVEMVDFQASRSSVVENVREIWSLTRFLR